MTAAAALALRIQAAIHEDTGLTCSIGVAPNKLIAKMASEFRKPNGVSVIYESELIEKIWPLPCRKISGIGPKAGARLEQLGIRTIGELARCERALAGSQFGPNHGAWMYECAWGRDDREVVTESEPVSMSRETTFERDLHAVRDRAELGAVFTDSVPARGAGPTAAWLRRAHHRHQAALRQLPARDARADARVLHLRCRPDPAHGWSVPEARAAGATAAPARRQGGGTGQAGFAASAGACEPGTARPDAAILRSPVRSALPP